MICFIYLLFHISLKQFNIELYSPDFLFIFFFFSKCHTVADPSKLRTLRGGPAVMALEDFIELNDRTYPLEQLQAAAQDKSKVPKGVDVHRLEAFLSDADFEKAFGMSRDAYGKLPKWKATKAKQAAGLF